MRAALFLVDWRLIMPQLSSLASFVDLGRLAWAVGGCQGPTPRLPSATETMDTGPVSQGPQHRVCSELLTEKVAECVSGRYVRFWSAADTAPCLNARERVERAEHVTLTERAIKNAQYPRSWPYDDPVLSSFLFIFSVFLGALAARVRLSVSVVRLFSFLVLSVYIPSLALSSYLVVFQRPGLFLSLSKIPFTTHHPVWHRSTLAEPSLSA